MRARRCVRESFGCTTSRWCWPRPPRAGATGRCRGRKRSREPWRRSRAGPVAARRARSWRGCAPSPASRGGGRLRRRRAPAPARRRPRPGSCLRRRSWCSSRSGRSRSRRRTPGPARAAPRRAPRAGARGPACAARPRAARAPRGRARARGRSVARGAPRLPRRARAGAGSVRRPRRARRGPSPAGTGACADPWGTAKWSLPARLPCCRSSPCRWR